jgi:hypothetical protein
MSHSRCVRRILRLALTAFAAACLLCALPASSPAATLRSLIAESAAPPVPPSTPHLDRELVNYSVLDSERWFVVAYQLPGNSGVIQEPLFVDRYDRAARQWWFAAFSTRQLGANDSDCLGSAVEVAPAPSGFFLTTHLNPSVGCTLVLSLMLELRATLNGWPLASFSDGSVVYHRSQIQYGPLHAAEIAFYNAQTGRSYLLYPREPYQAIRQAEIDKLTAFFDANPDWCNQHNHPCDPERFDNVLEGNVAFSEFTDALAFLVDYGSDPEDSRAPPVTMGQRKVLYVFRYVHKEYGFQYREMLYEGTTGGSGGATLEHLLAPAMLQRIFSK